jgi:hypothetical protein
MTKEQEEINKYLTEVVTGIPFTELPAFTDYFTWEGFGKLWEWGPDQDWWDTFMTDNGRYNDNFEMFINENLIDPEPFAKAVADFLQKK